MFEGINMQYSGMCLLKKLCKMIEVFCQLAFHHSHKYLRQSPSKEKRFTLAYSYWRFQFTANWTHCFWACGEVIHHVGGAWWSKTAHLIARKQKISNKGATIPKPLQGHAPNDLIISYSAPPLEYSTIFQQHHPGNQTFNTQASGDIHDPDDSRYY